VLGFSYCTTTEVVVCWRRYGRCPRFFQGNLGKANASRDGVSARSERGTGLGVGASLLPCTPAAPRLMDAGDFPPPYESAYEIPADSRGQLCLRSGAQLTGSLFNLLLFLLPKFRGEFCPRFPIGGQAHAQRPAKADPPVPGLCYRLPSFERKPNTPRTGWWSQKL